jgi:hypothetical protein
MEVIELAVLQEEEEVLTQIEEDIDLTALRYWREASRPDVIADESSEP